MDSEVVGSPLDPGAEAPPNAEQESQGQGVQDSPDAAAAPPTTATDQPDYKAMAEHNARIAAQAAAEVQQYNTLLQRAQQQAVEQQAFEQSQSRRQQAYQMAQNLEPQAALDYVRRFEDQEIARLHHEKQQVQQQAQAHLYQTMARVAAPQYAQELAKQHGLPADYVAELAALPPEMMDQYVPSLKARYTREQQVQRELDQLRRSQNAQELQATGAYTVGSGGGTPVTGSSRVTPGSPDYDSDAHLRTLLGFG